MRVVVPSRGREDRVNCLAYVPSPWCRKLEIVVPLDEVKAYTRAYPYHSVRGCPMDGIAPTRQWIIENYDDQYIFMLDDDARFFYRQDMHEARLTCIETNVREQLKMWRHIRSAFVSGFPWVGVSYRSGNNHVNTVHKDNTKSFSVWGVNREVLLANDIRFDRTKVMEDFQVILSLLTLGYSNRVFYRWCWDQAGSQAAGGCSVWRTPEIQAAGARALHKLFPEFVTVVEKQTKSGWWGDVPRVDVRIGWQKAHKKGLQLL